jgi:hypothetical protein
VPRSRALGVRGRVRYAHLDDPPAGAGTKGREGLRQGPKEPRQEHDAFGEHEERGHGAVHGGGGFYDQGALRGLRRAGARAILEAGPGRRHGQPRRPQGRAHRGERVRAFVEARGSARWSTCRRIPRTSRPSRRPSASSRCSFGRPRPGHAWRSWRPSAERCRRSPRRTPRATSATAATRSTLNRHENRCQKFVGTEFYEVRITPVLCRAAFLRTGQGRLRSLVCLA